METSCCVSFIVLNFTVYLFPLFQSPVAKSSELFAGICWRRTWENRIKLSAKACIFGKMFGTPIKILKKAAYTLKRCCDYRLQLFPFPYVIALLILWWRTTKLTAGTRPAVQLVRLSKKHKMWQFCLSAIMSAEYPQSAKVSLSKTQSLLFGYQTLEIHYELSEAAHTLLQLFNITFSFSL